MGEGELQHILLMGRILVQGEEKFLEIGHGDDYTTLWIYLMSLNYTLGGKSYVTCLLPQSKNIFRSY